MVNLSNNKQLADNRQHSTVSNGKQKLLFPLEHLILFSPISISIREGKRWASNCEGLSCG